MAIAALFIMLFQVFIIVMRDYFAVRSPNPNNKHN